MVHQDTLLPLSDWTDYLSFIPIEMYSEVGQSILFDAVIQDILIWQFYKFHPLIV